MTLFASQEWQSKISLGGWTPGGAGDAAVIEPATGDELGRTGRASVDDVARASALAASKQGDWAALPFTQRSAVLRRAGQLFLDNADEISEWIVRESGGIGPKAGLEIQIAAEECFEAAALAAHPTGDVLR